MPVVIFVRVVISSLSKSKGHSGGGVPKSIKLRPSKCLSFLCMYDLGSIPQIAASLSSL